MGTAPTRVRTIAVSSMTVLLCCAGCRDNGNALFEKGRAAYERAVKANAPPESKAFDEALELLNQVPPDSTHAAEANKLKEALQRSRRQQVLRSLAPAQRGQREDDVEAVLQHCGELAQRLGQTPEGAARQAVRDALEKCRRKADEMDTLHAH